MKQKKSQRSAKGLVSLVGAGPGDPGLMTMKGWQRLQAADVVVYDRLVHPALLAALPPQVETIFVGKRGSYHILQQDEIQSILVRKARQGKRVVRLKGGDPFIFGRGGEEAEALRRGRIPFEIVPGVTSAVAVPAYAGIPVTHRDYATTVALVSGHEDPHKKQSNIDWNSLARINTLIFFMGMTQLPTLIARLRRAGRSPRDAVAVIQWGTVARQKTVVGTMGTIARKVQQARMTPPGLVVIGEVVRCRRRLRWWEQRPLFGQQVLVLRARDQASILAELLRDKGADVVAIPLLERVIPHSTRSLDHVLTGLHCFDWMLFTSSNGVEVVAERLRSLGRTARDFGEVKVACVGPATAARAREAGLPVDLIAQESRQEGLLKLLKAQVRGSRVLLLRAVEARGTLAKELKRAGAQVTDLPVYAMRCPSRSKLQLRELFRDRRPHWVVFTSSRMVENFVRLLGKSRMRQIMRGIRCAAIGPLTRQTLRKHGLRTHVVPRRPLLQDLVQAIVAAPT